MKTQYKVSLAAGALLFSLVASASDITLTADSKGDKTYNFYAAQGNGLIYLGQLNPQVGYNITVSNDSFQEQQSLHVQVTETKQGVYMAQTYCSVNPYYFGPNLNTAVAFDASRGNGAFTSGTCGQTSMKSSKK